MAYDIHSSIRTVMIAHCSGCRGWPGGSGQEAHFSQCSSRTDGRKWDDAPAFCCKVWPQRCGESTAGQRINLGACKQRWQDSTALCVYGRLHVNSAAADQLRSQAKRQGFLRQSIAADCAREWARRNSGLPTRSN